MTKSDQSFMRSFSLLIAGLCVLTLILIGGAWWIYDHEPKEINPQTTAQTAARIAPAGAVYAGDTGRAAMQAAQEAAAKAAASISRARWTTCRAPKVPQFMQISSF